MNFAATISLSSKYLVRYKRRYLFLFFALAFGICIVTVITSLKAGMAENVYFSAQEHYTGDLILTGYIGSRPAYTERRMDVRSKAAVFEAVHESKIPVTRYAERTLYNDDATVFFNGESVPLRYLNGVDWENERPYFDNLSYVDGETRALDDNSILLSERVAQSLGIKCGDNLLLELMNSNKQKDTRNFVVGRIFRDNTLFGFYKAFISRRTMNGLLGFEQDDCSSIGLFLINRANIDKYQKELHETLSVKTLTAPLLMNEEELDRAHADLWVGIKIFIVPIAINLSDINQILDALNILTLFLYIMMLIIILVSASVTYRLILHERTKEIGTMRAIGFYEQSVRNILISETFLLGTISIIIGFCLSLLLLQLASLLSFSWFPSFDIFLKDGHLTAQWTATELARNSIAIYIVLFIAVWFPTFHVSKAPLPGLLSGSN
ncbi:MAG: FtsX-like permease family protein [Spirochaetaceae bacterium]|jgi:ABC-type lipoprotein release transport system permease subunit|nr:FtsX-like permease family protein [Spirochaetaceae bacterium]